MLIIQNSLKVLVIFSVVCALAYVFSFQLLFLHTAFEVFYYGALFFISYVIGTSLFAMIRSLMSKYV